MEISTMLSKEFKVTVIKVLIGLEKRMEYLNETINKKTENIQKKVKDEELNN